jgi:DNA-binding Lrp family transcriptional regulator
MLFRTCGELPLDDLSKDIIRKFQWPTSGVSRYTNKPSIYKMAKEFSVHPRVVKSRLNSMFESGIIRGVKFYADSRFMPWNRYFLLTRGGNDFAREILGHFSEFPFVERIIFGIIKLSNPANSKSDLTVEKEFSSISLIARDDLEMKKQLIGVEKTLGHKVELVEIIKEFPQKEKLVSYNEHSILNIVLYQDPMTMSITKIAHILGVPARTVRRKIENMLVKGVIFEEVSLDTSLAKGILLPSIIMTGNYQKWLPVISDIKFLHERLLLYKNWSRFSFFIFYAENFYTVDQLIATAKEIDPASMLTYRNGSYNNPFVRYTGI